MQEFHLAALDVFFNQRYTFLHILCIWQSRLCLHRMNLSVCNAFLNVEAKTLLLYMCAHI